MSECRIVIFMQVGNGTGKLKNFMIRLYRNRSVLLSAWRYISAAHVTASAMGPGESSRAGQIWAIATSRRHKREDELLYATEELRDIFSSPALLARECGYDLLKLLEASTALCKPLERISQVGKILDELVSPRRKHLITKQSLEYPKRILLVIEKVYPDMSLSGRGKVQELSDIIITRFVKECRKPTHTDLAIELLVRSPRFRNAFKEPNISVSLVPDYHLTLVPLLKDMSILPASVYSESLSELIARKAFKQLCKYYNNSKQESDKQCFKDIITERLDESDTLSDARDFLNVLSHCGFDLKDLCREAISKYRTDDWTIILSVGNLGVGDLPFLVERVHSGCDQFRWLEWLSGLENSDESLYEIRNALGKLDAKNILDLRSVLETYLNLYKLDNTLDLSMLLSRTVDYDLFDTKTALRPLIKAIETQKDGIADNIRDTSLEVVRRVVPHSQTLSANLRAELVTVIALLIERLPYTDPSRMDVFFHLSHLKGMDTSTVPLIPQRVVSDALLNGIPDRRVRSLLENRLPKLNNNRI